MSVTLALKNLAGVQITSTTLNSLSAAKCSIRKFQRGIRLGFLTCPVWELKARCLFLLAKTALMSHYKTTADIFL